MRTRVWRADGTGPSRAQGPRPRQRPAAGQRSGQRPGKYRVPRADVEAVWAAEDGRCECCGRPMDRRCAKASRRIKPGPWTGDNLALLCYDCDSRYRPGQTILSTRTPDAALLAALRVNPGYDPWQVLRGLLFHRGIYVPHRRDRHGRRRRSIWVPRLCRVTLKQVESLRRPPEWEITSLCVWPGGKVAPAQLQKCTRGLARPDRSPWTPPPRR